MLRNSVTASRQWGSGVSRPCYRSRLNVRACERRKAWTKWEGGLEVARSVVLLDGCEVSPYWWGQYQSEDVLMVSHSGSRHFDFVGRIMWCGHLSKIVSISMNLDQDCCTKSDWMLPVFHTSVNILCRPTLFARHSISYDVLFTSFVESWSFWRGPSVS